MPDVRAGNATVNARGDETLAAVQEAAAAEGQWLPVDVDGRVTIAELCAARDGGPREARYGPFRARVLSLGSGGMRFGTEAVKDVAGYDVRRAWLGEVAISQATLRLAARLLLAPRLACCTEAMRSRWPRPCARSRRRPRRSSCSRPTCSRSRTMRRRRRRNAVSADVRAAARGAGAELELIDSEATGWRAAQRSRACASGSRAATRAQRCRRSRAPGRTTRGAASRSSPHEHAARRIAPARRGPLPPADLVARVREAIAP